MRFILDTVMQDIWNNCMRMICGFLIYRYVCYTIHNFFIGRGGKRESWHSRIYWLMCWQSMINSSDLFPLQQLEREISFRTESGLYFSYYKQLVLAPSISQGSDLVYFYNATFHKHFPVVQKWMCTNWNILLFIQVFMIWCMITKQNI